MPQEGTVTVPPAGAGKISLGDVAKGLGLAVASYALVQLYDVFNGEGWPTVEEWKVMGKALIAFVISYILKNVFTNNVGQLFAKDKPVVTVSEQHLEKLEEQAKTNQ